MASKVAYILDTGPLSVLCRFPLNGRAYIFDIVPLVDILIPEAVIVEARRAGSRIAQVASPLVKQGIIQAVSAPPTPDVVDVCYSDELGSGERDVIRLALARELPCVLDDKDAFVVASRFRLSPYGFQDFVVKLAIEHGLDRQLAIDMVNNTSRQYPVMFHCHTLHLLRDVQGE